MKRLLDRLYNAAWPSYDCEWCIGQEHQYGCYCAYHGCSAPCYGPTRWQVFLRRAWTVVARLVGRFDPASCRR